MKICGRFRAPLALTGVAGVVVAVTGAGAAAAYRSAVISGDRAFSTAAAGATSRATDSAGGTDAGSGCATGAAATAAAGGTGVDASHVGASNGVGARFGGATRRMPLKCLAQYGLFR